MRINKVSTPPFYGYAAIFFIVFFHFILPSFNFIPPPYNYIGLISVFIGIWLVIWPWLIFKQHHTPEDFSPPTALVTQGPYKFSRNPMYLGMVLFLFGLAVCLQNILAFIFPILFFLIVHFMFIPFEQHKMEACFSEKYIKYKNNTPKWI